MLAEVKEGNFELMDQFHHLSSGYKSLFTQRTMESLNVIRQSLGGAGFSAWSGIPYLIAYFASAITYEGDNTVMMMQSFKYLEKQYKKMKKGEKLVGIYSYLNKINEFGSMKCGAKTAEDFTVLDQVIEALQVSTGQLILQTMENLESTTTTKKEAINHIHGNEIVASAECHLKYLMIAISVKNLSIIPEDSLRAHFVSMMTLTGLMFLQECKAYGYDSGYFKRGDNKLM